MSIYYAIRDFNKQFAYEPEIKNKKGLARPKWYIVAGMGGSHLAADLLKIWDSRLPLLVHKNYGLPNVPEAILKESLLIASSYSGNTEETLDAYLTAKKRGMPVAAIAVGGKLLELAKKDDAPFIQLPDTGIQPRSALGFSIKALLALMGEKVALREVGKLKRLLKPQSFKRQGRKLAQKLKGYVPVIYSSEQNEAIAYNWKIKFNETGKIPAFYNVFSELNHNEMTGFDVKEKTKNLSEKFYFILLRDKSDDARIQKRMTILKRLYQERGLPILEIDLEGLSVFYKIFASLVLADWAAYYTAKQYKVEPEQVPMVEEFKKLVA
jgi:glucose/mannose-6-phosphate isomerase